MGMIFNSDSGSHTLEETLAKKKKGHAPEMLLPLIEQFEELVKKGHQICIKGNKQIFHSFSAAVLCITLDTVEIPNF